MLFLFLPFSLLVWKTLMDSHPNLKDYSRMKWIAPTSKLRTKTEPLVGFTDLSNIKMRPFKFLPKHSLWRDFDHLCDVIGWKKCRWSKFCQTIIRWYSRWFEFYHNYWFDRQKCAKLCSLHILILIKTILSNQGFPVYIHSEV